MFGGLELNNRLNRNRFNSRHRALFDRDGVSLDFSTQTNLCEFRRADDIERALHYEDHGSDPGHAGTVAFREILNSAFYYATQQGVLHRIHHDAEITRLKDSRIAGCNFATCRQEGEFDQFLAHLSVGQ